MDYQASSLLLLGIEKMAVNCQPAGFCFTGESLGREWDPTTLMEATFNGKPAIERYDGADKDGVHCFEKAVVMRHNEGGMSRERRMEVYDLMRYKARMYCNMSMERRDANNIGRTLFMGTGPRSFKNESIVTEIFQKECAEVDGCKLMVAYSNNLTFCEQFSGLHLIIFSYLYKVRMYLFTFNLGRKILIGLKNGFMYKSTEA